MERWLLIVVVLYVVWRVLHAQGRHLLRSARGADDYSRFSRDPQRPRDGMAAEGHLLVVCDRCGVVVPESEVSTGDAGERLCASCAEGPVGEG